MDWNGFFKIDEDNYFISLIRLLSIQLGILFISLLLGGSVSYWFILYISIVICASFVLFKYIPKGKKRIIAICITYVIAGVVATVVPTKIPVNGTDNPPISKQAENVASMSVYKTVTAKMEKISPTEAENKLVSGEKFFLYMGRETCPYCERFVEQLQEVDVDFIYYLDTENKTDELYHFSEKIGVKSVPQLLTINNGSLVDSFNMKIDFTSKDVEKYLHKSE